MDVQEDLTYTISLPMFMSDCPTWWINFMDDFSIKSSSNYNTGLLGKTLEKFNARFYSGIEFERPQIEFETKEDATAFILRWS